MTTSTNIGELTVTVDLPEIIKMLMVIQRYDIYTTNLGGFRKEKLNKGRYVEHDDIAKIIEDAMCGAFGIDLKTTIKEKESG